MTTLLLLRHGRTPANTAGVLAGWTPGVELDEKGRAQAAAVAERLLKVPLAAVVTSPLDRCRQTAAAVLDRRDSGDAVVDDRLGECRYGDWTGQKISKLAKDPMWAVVQQHPSAAVFPGPEGEALAATQARAVAAVRDWNARLGPDATWLACTHGDVIKAIVADALGMHLDLFQRITADPCSITAIRYTPTRPFLLFGNDSGGDLAALLTPPPAAKEPAAKKKPGGKAAKNPKQALDPSDAVLGGGAGHAP
ncbi:MAG: putative phosphoglycerate mutase [Actinomycetia bacterium]|nr:putative phosphoglycerate mutase [Actinomycetes bacterium]